MILIQQATIINEGETFTGSLLIEGARIAHIFRDEVPEQLRSRCENVIDARGLFLIPGVIDDQVHFREPGLTHKGDIFSESRAAVAGGVTSYMEMPNTMPQTITNDELRRKQELAAGRSAANYSFYMGATNDNIRELQKVDPVTTCGVKVFMGSSTGNMLVDDRRTLQQIFAEVEMLIATHCESEELIRENRDRMIRLHGEEMPVEMHPLIRTAEACYRSSAEAVELADRYGSRLHVLHLSTAQEMSLFSEGSTAQKRITAEVCVHHLWFSDADYALLGSRVKWNPAVKSAADREALREALRRGRLDVVATDHAPHLLSEKEGGAIRAASGGPLVQHSLAAMWEMTDAKIFTRELVVERMCHAPARLFGLRDRGFIREGYHADLVLVDPSAPFTVTPENILYKCGWSPFEGITFGNSVSKTFVNGMLAYDEGRVSDCAAGQLLTFER
ncbi:MAG TPA: dihydroorotase [Proteiniphilum sp.]|nr:dihydroorotase [Proteiniphilum sp.]HPJ50051.1 dihydroorotase [Proteiniphilum sp.]HPR21013.1 dihydroorotase [Proteiniphilum sp.]